MELNEAEKLARELKISPVQVIREELEVFILDGLSKTPISRNIVFKGGTALRLVYQSPRFSQDLDFSVIKKVNFKDFKKVLTGIVNDRPELLLKDIFEKRNTLFALISTNIDFISQQFSIKVELSKKDYHLKKGDYRLSGISSPTSPLTPLIYVYSLERILYEKLIAIRTREAPRDYFDIWWISERLKKKIDIPKPKVNKAKFVGEINQLLPDYLKNWSREFLRQYE